MCTWYGLNRPVIASTASYTATWTVALSRKPIALPWVGPAFPIVCTAIAFQSVTASARTTDDIARGITKPTMGTQNFFSIRISYFLSQYGDVPEGLANWGKANWDAEIGRAHV